MLPLYEDSWFTFRFADDRHIPRFHLEGVEAGRRVEVYKIDPGTNKRLGLLATHGLRRHRTGSITAWVGLATTHSYQPQAIHLVVLAVIIRYPTGIP